MRWGPEGWVAEMGKGIEGCARACSPEKPHLSLPVSSALFVGPRPLWFGRGAKPLAVCLAGSYLVQT